VSSELVPGVTTTFNAEVYQLIEMADAEEELREWTESPYIDQVGECEENRTILQDKTGGRGRGRHGGRVVQRVPTLLVVFRLLPCNMDKKSATSAK